MILEGRELDVTTGSLGEIHRREVPHPIDLGRELFLLTLEMFTPSADVGESKAGGVTFLVQGGAIPANTPLGAVVSVGTIFRVLRIFPPADGKALEIVEVRYSYFRVERLDGANARCEIVRGMGDPLTNRFARKNKLVALGIKPSATPTRLRFLIKGDRQPAAGFRLIAKSIPSGLKPTDVGMTDREGRIVLKAGFADGLVSLRLMAGNDEPMLDMPVMPGESPEERTIVFEPRPLTLALEAKLDALRDAIIDVVAVRSRLEGRMKARLDGEDWPGLDEAIKEFRKLIPPVRIRGQAGPNPRGRGASGDRGQDSRPDQERPGPARRDQRAHRTLSRRRRHPLLRGRGPASQGGTRPAQGERQGGEEEELRIQAAGLFNPPAAEPA